MEFQCKVGKVVRLGEMAGLKYRSQVIVLPIQKVSQTLVKANLRPKNFCLGLCFVPAVLRGRAVNEMIYNQRGT